MRTALMMMCVSYVLWRPVSNGAILYPLLALLAALSVFKLMTGERSVSKPFAIAAYLLVLAGLLAAVVGSVWGTPGLAQQATVWFGSILIWGLWAASITRDTTRFTLRVLTIATICLSALIVLYVGAQRGLLPSFVPDALLKSQDAGYDLSADGSAIRLFGLSSLAAAGPLVSSALVAGRDTLLPSRRLLAVATVLAVIAGAVAGRRAIAAVTVISPLLTYLLMRLLRPRGTDVRARHAPVRVLVALPVLAGLLVAMRLSLLDRPLAAVGDGLHLFFNLDTASSSAKSLGDLERTQQAQHLMAAWGDRPLFGHGMGAVLPDGFTRSVDMPWMFELQYHDLLFKSGLVGVGLVLTAVGFVWVGIRRAVAANIDHAPVIVATSVAAVSMLIVNASNPYLQAVGHGWAIGLALGVANALLRPTHEGAVPLDARAAAST